MPEIKKTSAFLTINNANLDRNFTFKVIRSSQSLITTASVFIKRNYFLANRIDVKEGDKLFISLQNNNEDKVLIFAGVVDSSSSTASEIHILAQSRVLTNENFDETYKDTNLEKVLKELIVNLKFEAKDFECRQIVCQGKKENTARRLLEGLHYFIDLDRDLVVRDEPIQGTSYIVDENLYFAKSDTMAIFPIPQLEIDDLVEYQGQKFIVKDIVYHYLSKAQMILNVEKLAERMETQPEQKENSSAPTSKPAPEEYLYFENPQKLDELSEGARTRLINLAKSVKQGMDNSSEKFVKIYITSVHRSVESQVNILSRKMRGLSGTKNMFEYYDDLISEKNVGDSKSLNYLNAIQAYYDGTEQIELDPIRFSKVAPQHQEEIKAMGKLSKEGDPSENIKSPRTIEAERLLKEYMDKYVFRPSVHMSDIRQVNVADISIKGDRKNTAMQIFIENRTYYPSCANISIYEKCTAGYISTTQGEPHIHLRLN